RFKGVLWYGVFGGVNVVRFAYSVLEGCDLVYQLATGSTTTSEGEIGGGPVSAIEGQLQETVDAYAIGNSENVAIWKSTSDRRGRSMLQETQKTLQSGKVQVTDAVVQSRGARGLEYDGGIVVIEYGEIIFACDRTMLIQKLDDP
ncbi:hypothetical protein Tco_1168161, partial [Tanacetum coccineum]